MRALLALFLVLGFAYAERPLLVATIPPYAALARAVLGEGWEVRALVPPGANPHVYAPRPSDLKAVQRARLVVQNGLGLDDWLVEKLVKPSGTKAPVVVAAESAKGLVLPLPSGKPDPHVWTDPLAMSLFVCDLARAAGALDAEGAEGYLGRARALKAKLLAFLEEGKAEVAAAPHRAFVAYKNPFTYLAARFGLERAFLIGKTPSAEPTARELVEARKVLKRLGLRTIVAPYQLRREADRVAKNLGVRAVYLDLLNERNPDYLATWRENLKALLAALR